MGNESAEKEAFFKILYALDDDDEGPEKECKATMMLASSKKELLSTKQGVITNSHERHDLARTVSAPLPKPSTPGLDVSFIAATPFPSTLYMMKADPDQITKVASLAQTPLVTSKVRGKRKRGQSLDVMPESQRIFGGLAFYFLPNNDIAPSRRLRIRRALEWGAIWIKDWKNGITHVIVDKGLTYKDVLSYLKLQALPPNVVLVNETYPSECMSFRYLVNPAQGRYLIDGQQKKLIVEDSSTSATSSLLSLACKPGKPHPPQTPSHTNGSDDIAITRVLETASKQISAPCDKTLEEANSGDTISDALDEAISEARAFGHLPLDLDENDEELEFSDRYESDDEAVKKHRSKRTKTRKGSIDKSWQQNFACMQKNSGTTSNMNPNARTIDILQKMADYYDRTKDQWRTLAYRRAISALCKQPSKITTKDEAFALPFIGERLADKIVEIVCTNHLRRLDHTSNDPADVAIQLFLQIYGIGYAQATTFIAQGHRTLSDIRDKASLTRNQRIGLDHYEDFQTRIPREEVEQHGLFVQSAIAAIDPNIQVTIGGSYRRGAADSGDVDFILTAPEMPLSTLRTLLVESIIPTLFTKGYLKCTLAAISPTTGTKWHGAASLPSYPHPPSPCPWRRIDFLLVPSAELGAALIYFTGNDIFNRSIRLLASKKGMRLNQRGLWRDVLRGPSRERITQGQLVEGRCERRIFEILGVPWRRPEERIC